MGKTGNPRHGSMQFWPRKRAAKPRARVRNTPVLKEAKPVGFAAYKAGMTRITITDNRKTSQTKGENVAVPVTVMECPPLTLVGVRAYDEPTKDLFLAKPKHASRLFNIPKVLAATKDVEALSPETPLTLLVLTNPPFKKTPEFFELSLGGSREEKIIFIKEHLNKPITVSDVFSDGDFLDARGVTKGKGNQGPVKRFGVGIRARKSEKTKRGPGSLGSWKGQQHMMYRIAFSGQMGFQQRTTYNLQVMKIGDDPKEVNAKGGFVNYGLVKSPYMLVKGSVPGPKKRLISFTKPLRPHKQVIPPVIERITTRSQQRR